MSSSKLPAIQFYPGDWRKDPGIQTLNHEEKGIWLEILFIMHESDRRGFLLLNGLPIPDTLLANILKISLKKLQKFLKKANSSGIFSTEENSGVIFNRRMVRDDDIRKKRSDCGQLGGNPAFQRGKTNPYYDKQTHNQIDKQTYKQKITPSSSSSSSSSTTVKGGYLSELPGGQSSETLGGETPQPITPSTPESRRAFASQFVNNGEIVKGFPSSDKIDPEVRRRMLLEQASRLAIEEIKESNSEG